MILRVVLASLRRRFRQLALILTAVAVAAATVSTLAAFSARTHARLGDSLSAFGPNLTVRPQVGGLAEIPAEAVARIRGVAGVQSAVAVARSTAGVTRVEVRAEPERLSEVARAIEARVEGIEAAPLLRVSESDARLTRRLTRVLMAVSAVSLVLALISVAAATTALLGERRTEVGLLLALGYTGRRVGAFLAAELLVAALLAGMVGEVLGELAAGELASRLLGGESLGLSVTWSGFAASAAAAVLVVGSSLGMALRRIGRLDAARVLRGE